MSFRQYVFQLQTSWNHAKKLFLTKTTISTSEKASYAVYPALLIFMKREQYHATHSIKLGAYIHRRPNACMCVCVSTTFNPPEVKSGFTHSATFLFISHLPSIILPNPPSSQTPSPSLFPTHFYRIGIFKKKIQQRWKETRVRRKLHQKGGAKDENNFSPSCLILLFWNISKETRIGETFIFFKKISLSLNLRWLRVALLTAFEY